MAKKNSHFSIFSIFSQTSYDSNESESEGKRLKPTPLPHTRLWFFFSRPFHENFKFLKNCPYDFHEILHSHSTPKGAPACAKASKSYGWDVRNIAKINPKTVKKQPFFNLFDFRKNCPYDSNEILYSPSTQSFVCNFIKFV